MPSKKRDEQVSLDLDATADLTIESGYDVEECHGAEVRRSWTETETSCVTVCDIDITPTMNPEKDAETLRALFTKIAEMAEEQI